VLLARLSNQQESAMRNTYLVYYDICDDKRLRRVSRSAILASICSILNLGAGEARDRLEEILDLAA